MKVAEHATQRYTLEDEVLPCNPSIMAIQVLWSCKEVSCKLHTTHTKLCYQLKMDNHNFYCLQKCIFNGIHVGIQLFFSVISLLNAVTCLLNTEAKQKECKHENTRVIGCVPYRNMAKTVFNDMMNNIICEMIHYNLPFLLNIVRWGFSQHGTAGTMPHRILFQGP